MMNKFNENMALRRSLSGSTIQTVSSSTNISNNTASTLHKSVSFSSNLSSQPSADINDDDVYILYT